MTSEDEEMSYRAPMPQSIAVVAVATAGCLAVAYLLWGLVTFSAKSMHDAFGDVALPMFTGRLIQGRALFWALPGFSLLGGAAMIARGKHSVLNLVLYVSALVFSTLVAITFTLVSLAIPWMPLIGNKMRNISLTALAVVLGAHCVALAEQGGTNLYDSLPKNDEAEAARRWSAALVTRPFGAGHM